VTQDMIGQKKSCTARIQHWLFFVTQDMTHKKSSNEDTFSKPPYTYEKIKKWRNSFWRWKWKRIWIWNMDGIIM